MASFSHVDWRPQFDENEKPEETRTIGFEFEAQIKELGEIHDDFKFLNEEWLDDEGVGIYEPDPENEDDDYYDEDWERDSSARIDYIEENLLEKGVDCAGVGYDGGGKEFVTWPDSVSLFKKGGSERFKALVKMLNENTKADVSSGTHVHVSKLATDTPRTWDNIYWFCMCFSPQLQKLFGRRSRWAEVALPSDYFTSTTDVSHKLFEAPKKRPLAPPQQASKHAMVNDRGDRYEFRGPKSTNNLEEALAWAELCYNIVNLCANGYIKDMPFSEVLRGKHIRAYADRIGKENPLRKLSSKERATKISELGYVVVDLSNSRFEGGTCA